MRVADRQGKFFGISFIGWFYIFGAVILLAATFAGSGNAMSQIAAVHGFPALAGWPMMVVVAILGLTIAYGLLQYTRWGYWLTITYLLYLMVAVPVLSHGHVSAFGNVIWPLGVVIYLGIKKEHYFLRVRGEAFQ